MPKLPNSLTVDPEKQWTLDLIDGHLVLFENSTKRELIRWIPDRQDQIMFALEDIWGYDDELTTGQQVLAIFWTGYFYARAVHHVEETAQIPDTICSSCWTTDEYGCGGCEDCRKIRVSTWEEVLARVALAEQRATSDGKSDE